jgi:hypothetical protein
MRSDFSDALLGVRPQAFYNQHVPGKNLLECEPAHNAFLHPAVEHPLSHDREPHVPKEDKMDILFTTFGSDPAAEICIGSLVFLLMYSAGFVLFQNWSRIARPTPVVHRHIISGLSAALAAMVVAFWLHAGNVATASAEGQLGAAVAPQELHGYVKVKPMPVQTFEDMTLIYPGRN